MPKLSAETLFHRAAKEDCLDVLKRANTRDVNVPDELGMSPTHWAAFFGNLNSLRLIVGKGGDIEKTDYGGNTAIHHAATNGHLNCVSFLDSFGANLWALNNDFKTALDIAAIQDHFHVVQYLDTKISQRILLEGSKVTKLKAKSLKEATKRIKANRRKSSHATTYLKDIKSEVSIHQLQQLSSQYNRSINTERDLVCGSVNNLAIQRDPNYILRGRRRRNNINGGGDLSYDSNHQNSISTMTLTDENESSIFIGDIDNTNNNDLNGVNRGVFKRVFDQNQIDHHDSKQQQQQFHKNYRNANGNNGQLSFDDTMMLHDNNIHRGWNDSLFAHAKSAFVTISNRSTPSDLVPWQRQQLEMLFANNNNELSSKSVGQEEPGTFEEMNVFINQTFSPARSNHRHFSSILGGNSGIGGTSTLDSKTLKTISRKCRPKLSERILSLGGGGTANKSLNPIYATTSGPGHNFTPLANLANFPGNVNDLDPFMKSTGLDVLNTTIPFKKPHTPVKTAMKYRNDRLFNAAYHAARNFRKNFLNNNLPSHEDLSKISVDTRRENRQTLLNGQTSSNYDHVRKTCNEMNIVQSQILTNGENNHNYANNSHSDGTLRQIEDLFSGLSQYASVRSADTACSNLSQCQQDPNGIASSSKPLEIVIPFLSANSSSPSSSSTQTFSSYGNHSSLSKFSGHGKIFCLPYNQQRSSMNDKKGKGGNCSEFVQSRDSPNFPNYTSNNRNNMALQVNGLEKSQDSALEEMSEGEHALNGLQTLTTTSSSSKISSSPFSSTKSSLKEPTSTKFPKPRFQNFLVEKFEKLATNRRESLSKNNQPNNKKEVKNFFANSPKLKNLFTTGFANHNLDKTHQPSNKSALRSSNNCNGLINGTENGNGHGCDDTNNEINDIVENLTEQMHFTNEKLANGTSSSHQRMTNNKIKLRKSKTSQSICTKL